MPCTNDYGPNVTIDREDDIHSGRNAARLCAIMKVLDAKGMSKKVLDTVDWKEAGTSRKSFQKWWTAHQERDAVLKQREAELRTKKERAKALALKPWSELTNAERRLVSDFFED